MNFDEFFKAARRTTDAPFQYQRQLACGEQQSGESEATWLGHGDVCQSKLINIPTGLGKTAAVVLVWLYNRVALGRSDWPRRLVYCLPMRTLVEQTEREVRTWLGDSLWDGSPATRLGKVGVHVLMGGEDAGEWDIYPEENAILIGTQDMLLSRALDRGYPRALAGEVLSSHVAGTLSLVIVNTVERAQAVFGELRKQSPASSVTLLHSRFRPRERQALVRSVLQSSGDHIVVSTQVVEAGVDLSARTLFTELAPWSSLVQRFGRCHRHGEMTETGADIWWMDVPDSESAPYSASELAATRDLLGKLTNAAPAALAAVTAPPPPETPRHVVRPKDLRELFDTTPDIAGAGLDISRFIREAEGSDCLVFWRPDAPAPGADEGSARDELCPVPVGRLRELADKERGKSVWVWDALDRDWVEPDRFIPGCSYWLLSSFGAYDPALGFDGRSKSSVAPVMEPASPPEAHDDEVGTTLPRIETLEAHTASVVARTTELVAALDMPTRFRNALSLAATWHDVGKSHPAFQAALRRANPALAEAVLYAKSGSETRLRFDLEGRRYFRHELASTLAFRALAAATAADASLVGYLIAAHHGKVRLSLRSLPGENEPPRLPDGDDRLYARGVWDGDTLLPFSLAGAAWSGVALSLAPMQIGLGPNGEPSWLESWLALRDSQELGPFRLAFLETLLRAADMSASKSTPSHP